MKLATAAVVVPLATIITAAVLTNRLHAERGDARPPRAPFDRVIGEHAEELFRNGATIFRYDTFGDEAFWGGTLKLHQAIAGARFGGVGPGVSPATALAVGLKVDVDNVPAAVLDGIRAGTVDLNDQATVRTVLNSWGPGRFDAALFLDGKAFRPDGKTAATLIPPAFGLAGMNQHTFTGWGSVPYWNAFVANLEMHGSGTFFDPRLSDPVQFPVAARAGFGDVRPADDRVTSKLAALQFYQLSIPSPAPPQGS